MSKMIILPKIFFPPNLTFLKINTAIFSYKVKDLAEKRVGLTKKTLLTF